MNVGHGTPPCPLCGQALDDTAEKASDGNLVHARCESEYENNVYFREFEGNEDD